MSLRKDRKQPMSDAGTAEKKGTWLDDLSWSLLSGMVTGILVGLTEIILIVPLKVAMHSKSLFLHLMLPAIINVPVFVGLNIVL